ncbi:MAG TPA: tail fiber domain-containing protein [Chitinophagaceae bacterium]
MKKFVCLFSLLLATYLSFAQNVGIGTGTPTRAKLEVSGVAGNGKTSGLFGGDGAGLSFQRDWPTIGFNQYRDNAVGNGKYIANGFAAIQHFDPGSGYMSFDIFQSGTANSLTNPGTRALQLSSLGRVGISGAIPNSELQLPNTLNNRKITLWEAVNNSYEYYGFGIESGTLTYNVRGTGDRHRFYCGNGAGSSNTLMTISGNKKVVIGTQNGGSKLGINSADPQLALEVVQADHTGFGIIDPNTWNHWGLKTEMVGNDGNFFFLLYNGVGTGHFEPDGSYHDGSDLRLKRNIEPLPGVLPGLMKLQPKKYLMKYNNPGNRITIGFIAQDLKRYFPELVSVVDGTMLGYNEIPDMHTVNYSQLSVVSIKAIQEQQAIIEMLQQEINELRQDIKFLKGKIGH